MGGQPELSGQLRRRLGRTGIAPVTRDHLAYPLIRDGNGNGGCMRIRQPTPAPVVPIHTSLPRKVTTEPKEVNNYLFRQELRRYDYLVTAGLEDE